MARYCGENVAFTLDLHDVPSKLTQLKEAEDFRPRISFAYDDENDVSRAQTALLPPFHGSCRVLKNVSTIDFDTFSVSVAEVEDEKGFFMHPQLLQHGDLPTVTGILDGNPSTTDHKIAEEPNMKGHLAMAESSQLLLRSVVNVNSPSSSKQYERKIAPGCKAGVDREIVLELKSCLHCSGYGRAGKMKAADRRAKSNFDPLTAVLGHPLTAIDVGLSTSIGTEAGLTSQEQPILLDVVALVKLLGSLNDIAVLAARQAVCLAFLVSWYLFRSAMVGLVLSGVS
ncbi:unnamed protein product [Cyclocybe aegerita]|uniref:Uncharacterized protein n=1 Tax=Cyclocybe aegerita TaxID=1973307 RepID=A0A8S0XL35_CYCAE|nr:unnamed protein product [Cyclocybe aegerita]